MERLITLKIQAGDTTCASKPGHFCPAVSTRSFGTQSFCSIFNRETNLKDKDGWLQRWPECLDAERKGR